MVPELVVVGSVNQDVTQYVDELPRPGETVLAHRTAHTLGGKGANQAAAGAAMGVAVALVGAVGADDAGRGALRTLADLGIDVSCATTAAGATTGLAQITVDGTGENTIVVDSGANATVTAEGAVAALERLVGTAACVVLCQGELAPEVVDAVALATARLGGRFVLNLAPVVAVADETLALANPLVVNAGEATRLLGAGAAPADLATDLARRTGGAVVVTLGAGGAVVAGRDGRTAVPAPTTVVVDSTGAGDALSGVLAAALARGADLVTAVRAGVEAGSHAVGHQGTIDAYPARSDVPSWPATRVDEVTG